MILLLCFFYACHNTQKEERKSLYNVSIKYIDDGQCTLNIDTVFLFFEGDFNKDTIDILLNHEIFLREIISTEPSTGLAKEVKIPNASEIASIEIGINMGRLAKVEIDKGIRILGVGFSLDNLRISVYSKFPRYY